MKDAMEKVLTSKKARNSAALTTVVLTTVVAFPWY